METQQIHPPTSTISQDMIERHYQTMMSLQQQMINYQRGKKFTEDPFDYCLLVDEYSITPNGNSVILDPSFDRAVCIDSIMASIPIGTTGILAVGEGSGIAGNTTVSALTSMKRAWNITPQQPVLGPLSMIVYPNEIFILSLSSGSGLLFIEIMGKSLRGNDWRII